jgi:hypothetical protein
VESEDCRAVASAKAGLSRLQRGCCELRLGRPAPNESVHVRLYFTKPNRPRTLLRRSQALIFARECFVTIAAKFRIQQSLSLAGSKRTSLSPTQNALSSSTAISNPHLAAVLLKSTFDQFARNLAEDEDCRNHFTLDWSHSLQSSGRPFGFARAYS